jgi:hypothetical protein
MLALVLPAPFANTGSGTEVRDELSGAQWVTAGQEGRTKFLPIVHLRRSAPLMRIFRFAENGSHDRYVSSLGRCVPAR